MSKQTMPLHAQIRRRLAKIWQAINPPTATGARAFFTGLTQPTAGKIDNWMAVLMQAAGYVLLPAVLTIALIMPETRARLVPVLIWMGAQIAYLVGLEIWSHGWPSEYERVASRIIRTQIGILLATGLVWGTGGHLSLFWFLYFWPFFAAAIYFAWRGLASILVIGAAWYFAAGLLHGPASEQFGPAVFITNASVLIACTCVVRYLIRMTMRAELTERELWAAEASRDIANDIGTALSVKEVQRRIINRFCGLVGARSGSLMLVDTDGRLEYVDAIGFDYRLEWHLPPGEGVAGWVLQNGRPYLCPDTFLDDTFKAQNRARAPRSLIAVPLISHGEPIGVINVDSAQSRFFSEWHAEVLMRIAPNAALAIERAQFREGMDAFVASAPASEREICGHTVRLAHRLTRQPVALWQQDRNDPRQAVLLEVAGDTTGFFGALGRSIEIAGPLRAALTECQVIRTRPNSLGLRASPATERRRAERQWTDLALIPMVSGESARGVLAVLTHGGAPLPEWDVDQLFALGAQVGLALRNAELLGSKESRIRELKVVDDVSRTIYEILDEEKMYRDIVRSIATHLEASHCTLFMPAASGNNGLILVARATFGQYSDTIRRRTFHPGAADPNEEGLAGYVFRTGSTLRFADARVSERFARPTKDSGGARSMLVVPVQVADQTVGVISADQDGYGFFDANHEKLLNAIARQLGAAIQRARGLAILQATTERMIGPHSLDEVLGVIARGAKELLNATSAVIYLLNAQGQLQDTVEEPQGFRHPTPRLDDPRSITREIFETHEIYNPARFDENRVNPLLIQRGVHALLGIPIRRQDHCLAVLYVLDNQPHAFSAIELSLVTTLAGQAATAIERSRLLAQLETARREQLNAIGQLAEAISDEPEGDGLVRYALDRTVRLLRAGEGEIWLRRGSRTVRRVMAAGDAAPAAPDVLLGEGIVGLAAVGQPICAPSHIAMPLRHRDRAVAGAVIVRGPAVGAFGQDDQGVLETLAAQIVLARETAHRVSIIAMQKRLYEEILEADIDDIDRIVDSLYAVAAEKLDLSDALFYIALVDAHDALCFPRVEEQVAGERQAPVRWGLVDGERHPHWQARPQRTPPGLTERIITSEAALFIPEDFAATAVKLNLSPFEAIGARQRSTKCWLGVPMKSGGRVVGVIAVQDLERELTFDQYDAEILGALADQAAVAIQRARLIRSVKQEENENAALSWLSAMNDTGAYLIHRMSNDLGTLWSRVAELREMIEGGQPEQAAVIQGFAGIERDLKTVIGIPTTIQKRIASNPKDAKEASLIDDIVSAAVARALGRATSEKRERLSFAERVPGVRVRARPEELTQAIENIITNGLDEIANDGRVEIRYSRAHRFDVPMICVVIEDDGAGIQADKLSTLFERYGSTKQGHIGLGLPHSKAIIQSMGGAISAVPRPGRGTRFVIELPIAG